MTIIWYAIGPGLRKKIDLLSGGLLGKSSKHDHGGGRAYLAGDVARMAHRLPMITDPVDSIVERVFFSSVLQECGLTPLPTDPSRTRWLPRKRDVAFSAN